MDAAGEIGQLFAGLKEDRELAAGGAAWQGQQQFGQTGGGEEGVEAAGSGQRLMEESSDGFVAAAVVAGFRGSGQQHPWHQPWLTGDEGWVHVMHGSCRRWGLPAKQGQRQGQGETAAAAVEDDMGVAGDSGLVGENEEVGSWVFCSSPEKMELLPNSSIFVAAMDVEDGFAGGKEERCGSWVLCSSPEKMEAGFGDCR